MLKRIIALTVSFILLSTNTLPIHASGNPVVHSETAQTPDYYKENYKEFFYLDGIQYVISYFYVNNDRCIMVESSRHTEPVTIRYEVSTGNVYKNDVLISFSQVDKALSFSKDGDWVVMESGEGSVNLAVFNDYIEFAAYIVSEIGKGTVWEVIATVGSTVLQYILNFYSSCTVEYTVSHMFGNLTVIKYEYKLTTNTNVVYGPYVRQVV